MTLTDEIIELFETLLDAKGIEVPCADADEERVRHEEMSNAKIYGMEYWNLHEHIECLIREKLRKIEEILVDLEV